MLPPDHFYTVDVELHNYKDGSWKSGLMWDVVELRRVEEEELGGSGAAAGAGPRGPLAADALPPGAGVAGPGSAAGVRPSVTTTRSVAVGARGAAGPAAGGGSSSSARATTAAGGGSSSSSSAGATTAVAQMAGVALRHARDVTSSAAAQTTGRCRVS